MWLLFFKFTRWLYKTLNADMRPWQVALGITLGALAGLLPFGLAMLCVFVLIILVNLHFGSAMFSFGVFGLFSWPSQLWLIRPLGQVALEAVPQGPVIAAAQSPILGWLRLDYFDVAGAIALWLLIAAPLFVVSMLAWSKLKPWMDRKLKESRLLKWLSKLWLAKVVKFAFIG